MLRAVLLAAALPFLGGGKPAAGVNYLLGVAADGLTVEMRLRGEADGETRLLVPAALASDLVVSGAQTQALDATHRALRHKPGAKLRIRYRLAGAGGARPALGEAVFAAPEGWDRQPAAVRWSPLPAGWRSISDLDPIALARPLTVGDLRRSVLLLGPDLHSTDRALPGVVARVAGFGGDPTPVERLADAVAPAIAAERAYWGDETGPVLVARAGPAGSPILDRGAAIVVPAEDSSDPILRRLIVEGRLSGQTARRFGPPAAPPSDWLAGGLTALLAERILLRAGLVSPVDAVTRLAGLERAVGPDSRGLVLALKWDDEIRRKTDGKADLDDVMLRLRDHAARFPPGQAPDRVTGLVSAVWVTAGLDIRPDIARYAATATVIPLPEEMFDGCLQARVTVTPAFDAGFDAEASFAARTVKGVRRRGPAWNSGLRDGMVLEAWTYKAGDMTRQIDLTIRPPGKRSKPKKLTYWPYGDATAETRKLQLTPGLTEAQRTACGRKIGGL